MVHVDMNTGDTRLAPREEAASDMVEKLRPLSASGGPVPGARGYSVEVERVAGGSAVFTVSHGQARLVTCGLAWTKVGARNLWPELTGMYEQVYGAEAPAALPNMTPWLATIVRPPVLFGHSSAKWLGGLERGFAWAILDERLFA